jgi:hypothetical protein
MTPVTPIVIQPQDTSNKIHEEEKKKEEETKLTVHNKTSTMAEDPTKCPPEEEDDEHDQLGWRADPSESLSDWKIKIVRKSKQTSENGGKDDGHQHPAEQVKTEEYYVHKYVLAFGNRRSQYFVNLFRNSDNYTESESNTSQIEMEPLAAQSFPQLLDFLYFANAPLKIDTDSATPLFYLAEYLEMKKLRTEAMQFIQQDMSLENVGTYYEHARIFHSETIIELAKKLLSEHIMKVPPTSPIIKVSDPPLWLYVLEHGGKNNGASASAASSTVQFSLHLSQLIAEFGNLHGAELDAETFYQLCDATKMPKLSHLAALKFMEISDTVVTDASVLQKYESQEASLQERCASALSENWKHLGLAEAGSKLLYLAQRKPVFMAHVLTKSLARAHEELNQSEQSNKDLRIAKQKMQEELGRTTHELKTMKGILRL